MAVTIYENPLFVNLHIWLFNKKIAKSDVT